MDSILIRTTRDAFERYSARTIDGARVHARLGYIAATTDGTDADHSLREDIYEPDFRVDHDDTLALTDDEQACLLAYRSTRADLPDTDRVTLLVQVVPINTGLVDTPEKRATAEAAVRHGAARALTEWVAQQAVASVTVRPPSADEQTYVP